MVRTLNETIHNLSIFNKMEKLVIDNLCTYGSKKYLDANNLLYTKDEPYKHLYIVMEGKVKIYHDTLDGKEIILNIIEPYDFFGEECIYDNQCYSSNAGTIENSIIVSLPINILRSILDDNHQFSLNLISYYSNRLFNKELELEHCALQNTSQKIGCFFLQIAIDKTDDNSDNSVEIKLPYEKNIISSKLGMKAETFSRSLKKLSEHTGIRLNGKNITIPSIKKLDDYVCKSCSGTYPCSNKVRSHYNRHI